MFERGTDRRHRGEVRAANALERVAFRDVLEQRRELEVGADAMADIEQAGENGGTQPAAVDRRLTGIVIVKVEIDETGKVISARDMCQGPPFLSESAVKSARGAVFQPRLFGGVPVRAKGAIRYSFVRR